MPIEKYLNAFRPAARGSSASHPSSSRTLAALDRVCAVPVSEQRAQLDETQEQLIRVCAHADCRPHELERQGTCAIASLAAMPELLLAVLPAATPLLQ